MIENPDTATLWRRIELLVLAGFLIALYLPAWLQGEFLIDANDQTQSVALLRWTAHEWLQGRVPLWNPYVLTGYPAAAGIVAQVFYPPTLLFALPVVPALVSYYVLHALIAWNGFRTFAKCQGWRTETVLLTAVSYTFGVWMITKRFGGLPLYLAPASILPWILASMNTAGQSRGKTAQLAAAVGLFLLSGGPDVILYGAYLFSAYAFLLFLSSSERRSTARGLTVGFLIAIAIGAVQWIPTAEFIPLTERHAVGSARFAASFYVPLHHLLMFLLPLSFGNLANGTYVGAASFIELMASPGLVILAGAGFGLGLRSRHTFFWFLVLVLSLMASLGPQTPVHGLMADWLPGLSLMRRATRFLFLVSLGLIVISGRGLDRLIQEGVRGRFAIALSTAAMLLAVVVQLSKSHLGAGLDHLQTTYVQLAARHNYDFLWFSITECLVLSAFIAFFVNSKFSPRARSLALTIALVAQLLPLAMSMNKSRPLDIYFGPRAMQDELSSAAWPGRVSLQALGAQGWFPADLQFRAVRQVSGYAGLFDARQLAMVNKVNDQIASGDPSAGELLGIRYVIDRGTDSPPSGWTILSQTATDRIIERSIPPPGCWIETPDSKLHPRAVERPSPGEFVVRNCREGEMVILSETFNGGWVCRQADLEFPVQSWGEGLLSTRVRRDDDLTLHYAPKSFAYGLTASCIGIFWLAALALFPRRDKN